MMYPESFLELEIELQKYLSEEYHKDAPFRFAIAASQFSSLAAHLTHDQIENPSARPFGTKEGENLDFGHAILQLLLYGISRRISIQNAVNFSLQSLRDKDWKVRIVNSENEIKGEVASPGTVRGYVFVDEFCENLNKMPIGCILVTSHPTSGISQHLSRCIGVITDHGGMNCHAAIIVREISLKTGTQLPCIVGTGNATKLIRQGQIVVIEGNGRINLEGD